MKKNLFLISKPSLLNNIKEIFFDFDVHFINVDSLKDFDSKNKNILIIDIQRFNNFYESFFLNNNVVICFLKKSNNFDISKFN